MRTALTFVAILLLSSALAQASVIETLTTTACARAGIEPEACTYQADGGQHGDAGDRCAQASPGLVLHGEPAAGLLVPQEDAADNYAFLVTDADVGQPLNVRVQPVKGALPPASSGSPVFPYHLQVWHEGCLAIAKGETFIFEDGSVHVSFVPHTPGTYVAEVVLQDPRVPPSGGPASVSVFGASPATCHPMCLGDGLSATAGYTLAAWG